MNGADIATLAAVASLILLCAWGIYRAKPPPLDGVVLLEAKNRAAFVAMFVGLSGFVEVSPHEPTFRCDYCGCLVSAQRAKEHRARCTWDAAPTVDQETA